MSYDKKVLVLKEVESGFSVPNKSISGIIRFEKEDGVTAFYLTLVNVKFFECGTFFLYVIDKEKRVFSFELGASPITKTFTFNTEENVFEGVAVGLIYVKDGLPVCVGFSKSDFGVSLSELKATVIEEYVKKEKDGLLGTYSKYDDEVVATENYFERESVKAEESVTENASGIPYYENVKNELNQVFSKFEREEVLCRIIPQSKWVKINYSAEKYYVVGLVYENGKEKYICYGVPSSFSSPPNELKGYCSFIPKSPFNQKGDGYFIMFQDAVSGDCVKINE